MWLHTLKIAQQLRSAACLHTNQSRSYLNHLVHQTINWQANVQLLHSLFYNNEHSVDVMHVLLLVADVIKFVLLHFLNVFAINNLFNFAVFRRDSPWRKVLCEKMLVAPLFKKFTTFYGIRKFILCSQEPSTCPWLGVNEFSPCCLILFL